MEEKILIVDDEALNCELLEGMLELSGHACEIAMSGEDALRMVSEETSLVLLDVTMPKMNGFDVVRKMREDPRFRDLPIIMVTALSSMQDRLEAVRAGANDFIGKPVHETELRVRVESQLKVRRAQLLVKNHQEDLEKKVAERTFDLLVANDQLQHLSTMDPLTGFPNHRKVIEALTTSLEMVDNRDPCAVLFIDIDYFKSINDSCGHAAGDATLKEFCRVASGAINGLGFFGRWGGEEFVAILPGTDRDGARVVAERIRIAVSEFAFSAGNGGHVTCSIGAAIYPHDGRDRDSIAEAADRAMYAAKCLGRNQVRLASDPEIAAVEMQRLATSRDDLTVQGLIDALLALVEARDHYTGLHTDEVEQIAVELALALGLDSNEAQLVGVVGKLHDIGKVSIPDSILLKAGPLTEEEWALMKKHSAVGADVVCRIPQLRFLAGQVRAHHERWDGSGYPDGLAGEAIPLASRIIAVADTYSAMTTTRPYSPSCSTEEALEEIKRCAGTQFDPLVVEKFAELILSKSPARQMAA
jgi:two-component system, cell cycle response regulator